ncbi:MAG: glycoside hydrolase family 3 N-terminal domain-containing protein, partial [Patescibacteria group bacterium]
FKGMVVCDDLSMGAISKNYGLKEAAVKMVQAGCDLIIISNNVSSYDEKLPYQISEAILQAVSKGEIATSSIEASYNKIIKLKKDFGIMK